MYESCPGIIRDPELYVSGAAPLKISVFLIPAEEQLEPNEVIVVVPLMVTTACGVAHQSVVDAELNAPVPPPTGGVHA